MYNLFKVESQELGKVDFKETCKDLSWLMFPTYCLACSALLKIQNQLV